MVRALLALRPVVEATLPGSGGGRLTLGLATVTEPALRPAGPVEGQLCAGQLPARARTFLSGRAALRRALARSGQPGGAAAEIPYEADGVRPRLPRGSVGSLSHSGGVAVALAAPVAYCAGLGVDLERHPLPPAAGRVVLTGEERLFLTGTGSADESTADGADAACERRLRELFSAKESAYKALHALLPPPQRPTTLLGIAIRPVPGGFSARARGTPERVLHVHVRWADGAVLTWTAADCGPGGAG
ncbi:4'-phosphopantetheinyl transferase superfamily protein [Streptomyces sp. NPDC006602]|uniref:4'-phosphopantetheinyl transferase superfamily protein n=1 Tax=Streptomyces sp. NPDC006602 TaxID=3364751 RepID=UPI0036C34A23